MLSPRRPPALWLISPALLCSALASGADESLASRAPASTAFFAEARNAWDLLVPLTQPQVWTSLAEVAGQPARPEDVEAWKAQIRAAVKLEPAQAIRLLFSQRVAFIGERLGQTQDGVVMCRTMPGVDVPALLRVWNATPVRQADALRLYRLDNGVGLMTWSDVLAFGDFGAPDGVMAGLIRAAETPAGTLDQDETFRSLLARTPPDPDGILFVRLEPEPDRSADAAPASRAADTSAAPREPTSREARRVRGSENLPPVFRACRAMLMSVHRRNGVLDVALAGAGAADAAPRAPVDEPAGALLAALPRHTLAAWETRLDPPALLRQAERLPPRHVLRLLVELQPSEDALADLVRALRGPTCVAIGASDAPPRGATSIPASSSAPASGPSAATAPAAPPTPAVALLLAAYDAPRAAELLRNMVESATVVYQIAALADGLPSLPPLREQDDGDARVHCQDLTPLLPPRVRAAVGEAQLCWAAHGDALIVASSRAWLGEILLARRQADVRWRDATDLLRNPSAHAANLVVLQTGRAGALGIAWLDYLERVAPQTLTQEWWRAQQPARSARLGIEVVEGAPGLRVVAVDRDGPAAGLLAEGDMLVGYHDRRFSTTQPVGELRQAIEQRPQAAWMELLFEREGRLLSRRVPLPFLDPIQLLRRLAAIGEIAPRIAYHDTAGDSAGPSGQLTIELGVRLDARAGVSATRPAAAPR